MIEYFKHVVTEKYADFEGRARRAEFWYYYLVYFLLAIVANIIDFTTGMPVVGGLLTLALLIPTIAAGIRRLHDTDRSGWWLLIVFIPILGAIALIVFLATEGTAGPNRFGPDPKRVGGDVTDHLI